jgi:HTH-type transcriptional regulator, competence development regulator
LAIFCPVYFIPVYFCPNIKMSEPFQFGDYIRRLRKQEGIPLRKVASQLDIDPSTLGKIEKNTRNASFEQIEALSKIFKVSSENLNTLYLSDRIAEDLSSYSYCEEILEMTRKKISTQRNKP